MELRRYLALIRKWVWLILLIPLIAALSSYYFSLTLPPTYQATTTLVVGQALQNPNPSGGELQIASQLAQAYALLVKQQPILQATAEAVNWPGTWQTLGTRVSATVIGGQLIQITVNDAVPERARLIADEIGRQLIQQSPTATQQRQAEDQRAFVTAQLRELKTQIETAQTSLSELAARSALESDAATLQDLNARIAALQTKIDTWQKTYASLSALLNTVSSNFLAVLAPAQEPEAPISPNLLQNVLFAAIAGLILAGAAVFLLEYLDDTVKVPGDVQRFVDLPTLGTIGHISKIHTPADHLITIRHPRSPISEAYRVLRTNLRFSGIENPGGTLLVTSSGPGEGKTTTAANLAVILAQAGKRVIIVDTDLRRPSLHKFFGLPNEVGLCSLFLGDAVSLESVIQRTAVEGLYMVSSGAQPPNPAEILDSKEMKNIVDDLRAQADIVIFDSPPVLAVADACILASRCSGVVLVIEAGRTRTEVFRRAVDTLHQGGIQVCGVILNKSHSGPGANYYYYYAPAKTRNPDDRIGRPQA